MTRREYTQTIYQELRALNERIDYKILRGQRYTEESRRHRALLRKLKEQTRSGFLSRWNSIFQLQ